jgi:hypothetical protein
MDKRYRRPRFAQRLRFSIHDLFVLSFNCRRYQEMREMRRQQDRPAHAGN